MHSKKLTPALKKLVGLDKSLGTLVQRLGAPVLNASPLRSPYESLVCAIAHQQLHGKAAETILGRFMALTSPPTAIPTPQEVSELTVEMMRSCGLSNSKVKSIKSIATFALEGKIPNSQQICNMSNDNIIQELVPIYGVGKWTVEMLLIFQLERLDVWPVDDFGVRKGYQIWKKLTEMPTPKELSVIGEKWAPYQTLVALMMWKVADAEKLKGKK
jgi:DNA-3-methyladenine glycosylase II